MTQEDTSENEVRKTWWSRFRRRLSLCCRRLFCCDIKQVDDEGTITNICLCCPLQWCCEKKKRGTQDRESTASKRAFLKKSPSPVRLQKKLQAPTETQAQNVDIATPTNDIEHTSKTDDSNKAQKRHDDEVTLELAQTQKESTASPAQPQETLQISTERQRPILSRDKSVDLVDDSPKLEISFQNSEKPADKLQTPEEGTITIFKQPMETLQLSTEPQVDFANTINIDEILSGKDHDEKSAKSEIKILDSQHHFDDFNPDKLDVPRKSIEFIQVIEKKAITFENKVREYSGTNYSVDYFVLIENLTRLVESLDKVKIQDDEPLLKEKVRVINYIKGLQATLDSNVSGS